MRRLELQFAAREVVPGVYTFQSVVPIRSRHGDMVKTFNPHAPLKSEHAVARRGFDTPFLIGHAQAQRATVPGGEGERRRASILQVTIASIEEREKARLQEDMQYADEMINATAMLWGNRYSDPDGMFPGVYPNVTDQYRDFDVDPDRYADMFIRDAQYRLERHNGRPERRAEHKQERKARRRERSRNTRHDRDIPYL